MWRKKLLWFPSLHTAVSTTRRETRKNSSTRTNKEKQKEGRMSRRARRKNKNNNRGITVGNQHPSHCSWDLKIQCVSQTMFNKAGKAASCILCVVRVDSNNHDISWGNQTSDISASSTDSPWSASKSNTSTDHRALKQTTVSPQLNLTCPYFEILSISITCSIIATSEIVLCFKTLLLSKIENRILTFASYTN